MSYERKLLEQAGELGWTPDMDEDPVDFIIRVTRARSLREAASICLNHGWSRNIDWWMKITKKQMSVVAVKECVKVILRQARRLERQDGANEKLHQSCFYATYR